MHEGHRERIREKYKRTGLDSFADHEILELLLFYANKRGDTNAAAHNLINRFGSLSAVLEAPYGELIKTENIGDVAATLITSIPQIFKRYLQDKAGEIKTISCTDDAVSYLEPRFFALPHEHVAVLSLDIQNRINNFDFVSEGTINFAQVEIRKIVEAALRNNAYSIILAHNHPKGVAAPSRSDIETTVSVINAFEPLGIQVADHILFSDSDSFSMLKNDKLAHMFIKE